MKQLGGDALVATGASGHSRLSFALHLLSPDTIDRGPLSHPVRTGIDSKEGLKVQKHFVGRSGPAYIPDLVDFPLPHFAYNLRSSFPSSHGALHLFARPPFVIQFAGLYAC